jgi:hypothetical protein
MELQVKDFEHPDEQRPHQGKGRSDVVHLGERAVAASHFEPGWRWSVNVKPIAGTELCEFSHMIYCLSGHIRVHMSDGTTKDITPGAVAAIPPRHDAEVVGDEPCVLLDFGDISDYARR